MNFSRWQQLMMGGIQMDEEFRKVLQDAFEPPAPKRKEEFLKSVPQPRISNLSFMLAQAGYIRKHVWGISAVLFGIAFVGSFVFGKDVMWVISALLPFAAVSTVEEQNRSHVYLMSELEMTARFSLKSVVFARMGILGIVHFLLLLFLIPACARFEGGSVFRTGLYLLVPYLLTADAGLWAARRTKGAESWYACFGIAFCVSGLNLFVQNLFPVLFGPKYIPAWILLLATVLICGVKEWKRSINRLSEFLCA